MLNLRTLFLAAGLCMATSAVAARPAAAQGDHHLRKPEQQVP